ncbi:hypothetical protein [Candidatus Arsenophonus triatominarum]|uniref:hypothetical protein n=1 Tax=Candidatus Arsenophonus triatominarum TaxID=57911 RepID=UPI0007C52AE2|nr:hypothetical protein [Candidatus Arsenophonus triatominarum]
MKKVNRPDSTSLNVKDEFYNHNYPITQLPNYPITQLPNNPTTLGLPNFLDPAESAIAWAEQHKKVQLLGVQVQQLETERDCLKNLFKEGMTPTQFSKMLNGVNIPRVSHRHIKFQKWLKSNG